MLKQLAILPLIAALFTAPALAQNAGHIAKAKGGQSCAGCNLFQAELGYRDGRGMDFSNSRLRQANLSLVTYGAVNFSGADLSISNLFGARFNGSNFKGANLTKAAAVGTFFGGSNLTGANLTGANFSGADLSLTHGLTQSQINRACGDHATQLPAGLTIKRCR